MAKNRAKREAKKKKIADVAVDTRETTQACMVARLNDKKERFLEAYRNHGGNITAAVKAAGLARRTHYFWLKSDPTYAEAFAKATTEAKEIYLDKLIEECDRRALGFQVPVYDKNGNLIGNRFECSDSLLMFRMKKLDPSYRERFRVDTNIKTDYDAEAMQKLAATAQGRALIRQISDMLEDQRAAESEKVTR